VLVHLLVCERLSDCLIVVRFQSRSWLPLPPLATRPLLVSGYAVLQRVTTRAAGALQ